MLQLSITPAVALPSPDRLIEEEVRLYERVVQRDKSALMDFFDRLGPIVYCAALMHTGRQAAAEQVTEALFLAFWRDPAAFPPSGGPLGRQLLRRMTMDVISAPLN